MKTKKNARRQVLGRRAFMAGMGASVLAPLLVRGGSLALPLARAQAAAPPGAVRRLVVFFSPNGTVPRLWRPTGSGDSYAFAAGSILEPLSDWRSRLLVLDGIDFKDVSNHEPGMKAMLTGGGPETSTAGQSVDQYIAARIGGDTPFPSIELGVETDAWGATAQTRMLYAPGGEFVHPDQDPVNVYKRVFGATTGTPAETDARLQLKQSVLSVLRAELGSLRNRVGAEEYEKLDAHMNALRRVELGLSSPAANVSCDVPLPVMQLDPNAHENFADITRSQTDLLVAALACGMTRVISLQLSHTVGPHVFSWLGLSEGHHSLSHMDDSNTVGVDQFVKAERWIAEQFAYLLQQLDSLPEPGGDGSLLDNTLVVWAKELADGRLHNDESVPFIMAGASNYLSTGRYVQLGGVPHQQLLVSICHAMGLDNMSFGDTTYGTGPLGGLT